MKKWEAESLDKLFERAKIVGKRMFSFKHPGMKLRDMEDYIPVEYEMNGDFEVSFEESHCSCCGSDYHRVTVTLDMLNKTNEELEQYFKEENEKIVETKRLKREKELAELAEKNKRDKERREKIDQENYVRLKEKYENI